MFIFPRIQLRRKTKTLPCSDKDNSILMVPSALRRKDNPFPFILDELFSLERIKCLNFREVHTIQNLKLKPIPSLPLPR